jgi:hypothetical protein
MQEERNAIVPDTLDLANPEQEEASASLLAWATTGRM